MPALGRNHTGNNLTAFDWLMPLHQLTARYFGRKALARGNNDHNGPPAHQPGALLP